MGDVRYQRDLQRVKDASRPAEAIRRLSDDAVIQALAAASTGSEPYLANVLATEALNRLRRSRTVAAHIGEGVYTVDAEGKITSVNPAAERLLGWSETDLLGRSAEEALKPTGADGTTLAADGCPAARVMRGEQLEREECSFRRADGTLLPVSYVAAPIPGDAGPEGAVVAFREAPDAPAAEPRASLPAAERPGASQ